MEKLSLKQKIAEIAKDCGKVVKDSKNPHFKNTYASLDAVMEFLQPHLEKYRLFIYHRGDTGCVWTYVSDLDSEDVMLSTLPIPQNLDPQKVGSCVTYYRRYNLCMLFNLLFDEDDDGNQASGRAAPKKKAVTAKAPCPQCSSEMRYWSGKKGEVSKQGKIYQNDWAKNFCTNTECKYQEAVPYIS